MQARLQKGAEQQQLRNAAGGGDQQRAVKAEVCACKKERGR